MSRIGKQPIEIPDGVTVLLDGHKLKVKGPKGELEMSFSFEVKVQVEEKQVDESIAAEES